MSEVVLLDAGPLGRASNPSATPANLECYNWMESLLISGCRIIVPEIADYEIRRELLRAGKTLGFGSARSTQKLARLFAFDDQCDAQSRRTLGPSQKSRHTDSRHESFGLRRDSGGSGVSGKRHSCHRKCRPPFLICRSKRLAGNFASFLNSSSRGFASNPLPDRVKFLYYTAFPKPLVHARGR